MLARERSNCKSITLMVMLKKKKRKRKRKRAFAILRREQSNLIFKFYEILIYLFNF
jgi:hypothetical protein